MANISHGMDVEEVKRLGGQLKHEADQIRDIITRLNGAIDRTAWVGPDAVRFKNEWWPGHRDHLVNIGRDLDGFGQSALNNAREQEDVSGH